MRSPAVRPSLHRARAADTHPETFLLRPGYMLTALTKTILDRESELRDKWVGGTPMQRCVVSSLSFPRALADLDAFVLQDGRARGPQGRYRLPRIRCSCVYYGSQSQRGRGLLSCKSYRLGHPGRFPTSPRPISQFLLCTDHSLYSFLSDRFKLLFPIASCPRLSHFHRRTRTKDPSSHAVAPPSPPLYNTLASAAPSLF